MVDVATNPILAIEELRRLPFQRRRLARVGATHVYRSRNGKLYAPPGGLTAGELLIRAPREVYEVDLLQHRLDFRCVAESTDRHVHADIDFVAQWLVVDPISVVAFNVFDVRSLAYATVQAELTEACQRHRWITEAELSVIVDEHCRRTLDLLEGVRVDVISVGVRLDAVGLAPAGED